MVIKGALGLTLQAFLLLLLCTATHASEQVTRIAAASSMRFVLEELLGVYANDSSAQQVQPVYGSSGNLYRQIVQGAPYDLFLSADAALIEKLQATRAVKSQQLGSGLLVLYRNSTSADKDLLTLFTAAIQAGSYEGRNFKIAIANPSHAPYGKAAKEALQSMQLWQKVKPQLVVAEKVSQAAQFARSGAAGFALVSQSLATSLEGEYVVLPSKHYQSVQHAIASVTESAGSERFLQFLKSVEAIAILKNYGFQTD